MKAWFAIIVALSMLWPLAALAQDEEPSLGDLARQLRQNRNPQDAPVIDNDNLDQTIQDAKNLRPRPADKFVLSIDPAGNIKASSPDVSCSLSFNARAGALLVQPVLLETLPLPELLKIDGPGSIQDQNLELQVFNGTEWELREITVGLTLERKPGESAEMAARARVIPAAENSLAPTVEKRSDVTLLYHLKADAKPFTTAMFKENIGITPLPDEDWRWSIVEAKGTRPSEVQIPPEWLSPAPTLDLPKPGAPVLRPVSPQEPGGVAHVPAAGPAANHVPEVPADTGKRP